MKGRYRPLFFLALGALGIVALVVHGNRVRSLDPDKELLQGITVATSCEKCTTISSVAQLPKLYQGIVLAKSSGGDRYRAVVSPFRDIPIGTEVTVLMVGLPGTRTTEQNWHYTIGWIGPPPPGPKVAVDPGSNRSH